MNLESLNTVQIILGGVATLAIYSFLWRENQFYRFFEHLFIGISTGIGINLIIRDLLWPKIFRPLLGLDIVYLPDGTPSVPYDPTLLYYLIPLVLGLLYYTILVPRWAWIAQIVIGLSLGASAGLAFKGFFNEVMPQVYDSFRPLYLPGNLAGTISNLIFMATLLSVMIYFFFTFKRKPGGVIERTSTVGRWLMMGCFGAFFGSTMMARMALLIERLQFLRDPWWTTLKQLVGYVL